MTSVPNNATVLKEIDEIDSKAARSPLVVSLRRVVRRPTVIASLVWLVLLGLTSALAPLIAPYDPLKQDLGNALMGPGLEHLLGTDALGRDLLSRLMHGGGSILLVAMIPVLVSMAIGVPAGLLAGYRGGRFDDAAGFVVNVLLALPGMVIILAVAAISSNNLIVMAIVLGVVTSAQVFRLARATTSSTRDLLYVDAARVAALPRRRILARHVLPNVAAPLIVQGFLQYAGTFLFLTALSFLGLGFSPESPSWGQMTLDALHKVGQHPWLMAPVGVALIGTVMSINMVGSACLEAISGHQRPSVLPPRGARTRAPRPDVAPGLVRAVDASVLVVDGLSVTFPGPLGERRVVEDVSFSLRRGEAFGLVGGSGSGKTTIALAILGLLPRSGHVTAGRIILEGKDLVTLGEREKEALRGKGVAYIPQEPMAALDPCFTVRSQLSEPLRTHHKLSRTVARARALELLELVGIAAPDTVARCYPHQLSGGMAQRVAIAVALTGEPRVLIADEPTTALDVTIQAEILDLLRDLRQRFNMTLLLVSHDLGVVADICDRVAVMSDGRLVEQGSAEDVLLNPQHDYTRLLIDCMPKLVAL